MAWTDARSDWSIFSRRWPILLMIAGLLYLVWFPLLARDLLRLEECPH